MSSVFLTGTDLHKIYDTCDESVSSKIKEVSQCQTENGCSGNQYKKNNMPVVCRWDGRYILTDVISLCEKCDVAPAEFIHVKSKAFFCEKCFCESFKNRKVRMGSLSWSFDANGSEVY